MKYIIFQLTLIISLIPVSNAQISANSSIEDSIKLFISEITYERMQFHISETESEDKHVSETEKKGFKLYSDRFKGKANWEVDSISKLLLNTDWKECYNQVYKPLTEELQRQREQGRYNFQLFFEVDVGNNFMNSAEYKKVISSYIFEVPTSSAKVNFSEPESEIKDTSIERAQSGFLRFLLVLILAVVALLIFLSIYIFIRQMLKPSKSSESKSNTEVNQKYVDLKSKYELLSEEYRKLQSEVQQIHRNIEELRYQSLRYKNENQIIQENYSNSAERSDQNPIPSKIEFYEYHNEGIFDRKNARSKDDQRTLFKIEVNNSNGKLYLIPGKRDSFLIADKDLFLEPVCNTVTLPGGNASKIVSVNPGSVILQEGKWIIERKAEIQIK